MESNNFILFNEFSGTWRKFLYISHFEIKNSIAYCEDVNHSLIYWEAFQHFFNVKVEPKQFLKATKKMIKEWDREPTSDYQYDLFKKYVKHTPTKTHEIVYSIIDKEGSHVHTYGRTKGLYPKVRDVLVNNLVGIDLGNSRNFKSANELIKKVKILADSKVIVGSPCSWTRLAEYFDTAPIYIADHY